MFIKKNVKKTEKPKGLHEDLRILYSFAKHINIIKMALATGPIYWPISLLSPGHAPRKPCPRSCPQVCSCLVQT